MLKCDPRAFARCPYNKTCVPAEKACFTEGSDCDLFNQKILQTPITNADHIRSMSDRELATFLYTISRSCADHACIFCPVGLGNCQVMLENLRKNCRYNGIDHGPDYAGLANYLFDHWTDEVGGHRWMQTKNARKPDREDPTEVHIRGGYSEKRPPRAPKGYKLVDVKTTKFGYQYFKYVAELPKRKPGRPRKTGG